MRRARRIAFIIIVALVAAPTLEKGTYKLVGAISKARFLNPSVENAVVTLSYKLKQDGWMTFPLPPASRQIRLITNANLPLPAREQENGRWHYSVRYQFIDDTGKIVLERSYHYFARITMFNTSYSAEPVQPSFYLEGSVTPANAKITVINTKSLGRLAALRVQLGSKDPMITDVVARAYTLQRLSTRRVRALWYRQSAARKKYLARGSVYSNDLLSKREKRLLMKTRWYPLGPEGLEGRDYELRKIYVLKELEDALPDEYVEPPGVQSGPGHNAVIPLPDKESLVRLEFTRTQGDLPGPMLVNVAWRVKSPLTGEAVNITLKKSRTVFEHKFQGGALEIASSQPVGVKAFTVTDGNVEEITPDVKYVRGYVISPQNAVTYEISHYKHAPTSIKVEARRLTRVDGVHVENPAITYRFNDKNGKVTHTGRYELDRIENSLYDKVLGVFTEVNISTARNLYLSAPADVESVTLSSSGEVLVRVSTLPHGYERKITVPESYDLFTREHGDFNPDWFSIRPANYQELVKDRRSYYYQVQPRPPVEKEEKPGVDYIWESIASSPPGATFVLLIPRSADRETSAPHGTIYTRMKSMDEKTVELVSDDNARYVAPSVIYIRKNAGVARARLSLDGKPVMDRPIAGRNGQFHAPPVPAGSHKLKITSDDKGAIFFVNNIKPTGDYFIKRYATALPKGGKLTFPYRKTIEKKDSLLIYLYQPQSNDAKRMTIKAYVKNTGKRKFFAYSHTFAKKQYNVLAVDEDPPGLVLNSDKGEVDQGRTLFLPIGSDLPVGEYTISLSNETGPEGFVVLARYGEGVIKERKLFISYGDVE